MSSNVKKESDLQCNLYHFSKISIPLSFDYKSKVSKLQTGTLKI